MPELMPCPSCQATLRVPAGAEAIRCPQCKTVVTLTTPPAPAPLPMAKALPLPPQPVVPLPFDRPASPPPNLPMAKALAIDKPVVRGRVVRDEDEDSENDRPRPRPDSDDDKPDYGELVDHCHYARIAMHLFAAGAVCGVVMCLCFSRFFASLSINSNVYQIFYTIVMTMLALQSLCFMAGFACAIAGPAFMRPTAIVGLIVTMMHIGLVIPIILFGMEITTDLVNLKIPDMSIGSCAFFMASGPSPLSGYSDIPWLLLRGELDRPWYVVGIFLGGIIEFWRASLVGTLVQSYAAEGKSVELGYRALRFVYRIIWVVMIILVLKVGFLFLFKMAGGDAFVDNFYAIPVTLMTNAYFLWWTFTWYSLYNTIKDVTEVVLPYRFAEKRQNLDGY